MINKTQLKSLIKRTLTRYSLYSGSALELVYGTIAVESNRGSYLRQVVKNFDIDRHALGIAQMEKATFEWLKEKFKPLVKIERIATEYYPIEFEELEYNLELSILFCRLRYLADSKPLPEPSDIEGLANYWKRVYNTVKGAGKVEDFIKKYNK